MKPLVFSTILPAVLLMTACAREQKQQAYIDDEYVTVYAEQKQPMPVYTAYKKDGQLLGTFETFTRWNKGEADFYLGTNYRRSFYYFPQTGGSVESDYVYTTPDLLVVRTNSWQVLTQKGELLWGGIPDGCTLMKELQPKERYEEYHFLMAQDSSYSVMDERGRQLMTLTPVQYQQVEATFQPVQQLKGLTIVQGTLVTRADVKAENHDTHPSNK